MIDAATYVLPIVPSYVSTMPIMLLPYIADFISPCIYIIIACIHVPPAHFSDYADVMTTRRRTRIHTLFPRIPSMYLACGHNISVRLIDHFAHRIIICNTHAATNPMPTYLLALSHSTGFLYSSCFPSMIYPQRNTDNACHIVTTLCHCHSAVHIRTLFCDIYASALFCTRIV